MLGTGANSTTGAHSPPGNRRRIWPDSKSTFQPDPGFVRTQLLSYAVGLDQHILRISKRQSDHSGWEKHPGKSVGDWVDEANARWAKGLIGKDRSFQGPQNQPGVNVYASAGRQGHQEDIGRLTGAGVYCFSRRFHRYAASADRSPPNTTK